MAYTKHTWEIQELITADKLNNIENGVDAVFTLSHYKSILDFGILGGEENSEFDTNIIINAIKSASNNSQTLYFPSGDYFLNGELPFVDNLNIKASQSANFYKLDDGYTFRSKEGKGYGAGGKHIRIEGGNWIAKEDYSTHIYFNLMHVEDAIFKDMYILRCIDRGHVFDTQACKNIVIDGVTFVGIKTSDERYFTEAIQLDTSTAIGSSNSYEPDTYDGLACEDIVVKNCKTLPEFDENGSILRYAPSLVGIHGQTEGATHHDIKIYDNYLQDVIFRPQAESWPTGGGIHLRNAYDVFIENNTFYRTQPVAHATPELNITISESIGAKDTVADMDPATLYTAYEDVYNIKILNNSFVGMYSTSFESSRPDVGIIRISGSTKYEKNIKNIVISGNIFRDTINPANTDNNTFNTDTPAMYLNNISGISISNNVFESVFSMATIVNTSGLIINNNVLTKVYRTVLKISNSKGKFVGNYIDVTHGKIEILEASTIDIIDNNIYNFSLSNPVAYRSIISQDNTSYGKIQGNVVDYGGDEAAIYTNSAKVFVTNNDVNKIVSYNANAKGLITDNITITENEVASASVVND